MAKRKKRATARKTKSKSTKRRTGKQTVKRAAAEKTKNTAKKFPAKTARKRTGPRKEPLIPVIEGEIVDVIEEPVPGVVRLTEIATTAVVVPDSDDDTDE